MAAWTLVLADQAGGALTDVRAAATLTFVRNQAAQVAFADDLEADAAIALVGTLRSGIPKLRAYRDGTLRFNGQWAPMEEESSDGDQPVADLRATFRSPFDVLAHRYTGVAQYVNGVAVPGVTFVGQDAGVIARALITTANTSAPTGLKLGTTVATQTRDRIYENKQIAEAIVELTAVDGGFDFVERFVNEGVVLAAFDVVASQGTVVAAVFGHGPGTLANVTRVVRRWLPPVNRARVLGDFGLYSEKSDAASIVAYGEWWPASIPTASGVVEQATLDDKAIALLRPDPTEIVEFEPDPILAPQPWTDYWLGDTVTIQSRLGSLRFETTARINGITVTIDDEGNEASHTLTFENPTTEVT